MADLRFGPDALGFVPVVFFGLCVVPAAGASPWLAWLLLLPLAAGVWVARARVVCEPTGLVVCNGLGWQRHPWSDVEGFDLPRRGPVRLHLAGGGRPPLTALSRRELPVLLRYADEAARTR